MFRPAILAVLRALSAAAALSSVVGCSGGFGVAPTSTSIQRYGRVPIAVNPLSLFNINNLTGRQLESFDACPAKGPIVYVSSGLQINIFAGKFVGQAPCGRITLRRSAPIGLFVQTTTHDLYVAILAARRDVLVFRRGQTWPYNSYTDPNHPDTWDVTVAKDGTVIASNISCICGGGSISTWIGGPNGGTFVANYPMTDALAGSFVAMQKNGTIFFDGMIRSLIGALWSVSCPAGVCGAQTKVAGVSFDFPAGMAFDDKGRLLVIDDPQNNDEYAIPNTLDTFVLPNPKPSKIPLTIYGYPAGLALDELGNHAYVAGFSNGAAAEYEYPSGKLIGIVQGVPGEYSYGVAFDP